MRKNYSLIILCLVHTGLVFGQDSLKTVVLQEVVATGTKFDVPVEKSGKTITKFSAKDIEGQSANSLGDILNTVPNVQVDGLYGAPGTNLGYYVRGGINRQSVILLDGVPMVDPSGISPEFDLRLLSLDQVDNVEVMRGGLSTLYGSGAAASVINISLKKPSGHGIHGSLGVTGGSFGTFSQNISLGGQKKRFYFYLLANNMRSAGFTSADDRNAAIPFDKDGFKRENGLVRVGWIPRQNIDLQFFGGLDQFHSDYDGGAYVDAANEQEYQQFRGGLKANIDHKNGSFLFTMQQTSLNKEFISSFPLEYSGATTFAEAFDKYQLMPGLIASVGVSYQKLAYAQPEIADKDTTTFTIVDPYVSLVLDLPAGLNIQAGARLNNHSEYGRNFIYNINPSFLLPLGEEFKIKLIASASTSYITPSLYQLFSSYGNKGLNPEKTFNLEGGITLYRKLFSLSGVYFNRDETDFIGFQSFFDDAGTFTGGQYYNLPGERQVKGVEIETTCNVMKNLKAGANYSHITSNNIQSFYRIPKNKLNIMIQSSLWKKGNIAVSYQYTGKRVDIDYTTFTELTLESYQFISVNASQAFMNDRIYIYGSINNIFNEKYIWAPGFKSMPRNFTLGVKYKF